MAETLKLYAVPGTRADLNESCWMLDSDEGSVAEMMCPADIEEALAKRIAESFNAYPALQREHEAIRCLIPLGLAVFNKDCSIRELVKTLRANFDARGERCKEYLERAHQAEGRIEDLLKAMETIADLYHADRCPVYQSSGGNTCNCHVGIARAALALEPAQRTDTAKPEQPSPQG